MSLLEQVEEHKHASIIKFLDIGCLKMEGPPPLHGKRPTCGDRDNGVRSNKCAASLASILEQLLGPCSLEVSPEVPTLKLVSIYYLILKLEELCQAILTKDPLRIPCSLRASTVFLQRWARGRDWECWHSWITSEHRPLEAAKMLMHMP